MNLLITGSNGQLGSEIKNISHKFPLYKFYYTDFDSLDICDKKSIENYFKKNNTSADAIFYTLEWYKKLIAQKKL